MTGCLEEINTLHIVSAKSDTNVDAFLLLKYCLNQREEKNNELLATRLASLRKIFSMDVPVLNGNESMNYREV